MIPLYLGLILLSASVLLLEVGLTRVLAIAQWYHFAFLVVSLALLGSGAGGSVHAALPALSRPLRRVTLVVLNLGFSGLCVFLLWVLHTLPLDLYALAWDRRQYLYLALDYLALGLPFLCSGLVVSLVLESDPLHAGWLYGANLAGSALGTALAVPLIGMLGSSRLPLAAALLAALAAGLFSLGKSAWGSVPALAVAGALLGLLLFPSPSLVPRMDPHKSLVQQMFFPGARLVYSGEHATARVDVVEGGPYHSFPGLPLVPTSPLPKQMSLLVDGDQPSPLTLIEGEGASTDFLDAMLSALPYRLRPRARVLLIEPMGGLDLLQALEQGAREIVVLQEDSLIAKVVEGEVAPRIGRIFSRPQVAVLHRGARSYLASRGKSFDLIVYSLTGERTVVTAGAYSLVEESHLTVESFRAALRRLAPGGVLVVTRWLQQPPSEELRALTTVVEALERAGSTHPEAQIVAVRSWSALLLLARTDPWTEDELQAVRAFCTERRLDLVWLPGMQREEANRYNRVLEGPIYHDAFRSYLHASDRRTFLREWPADVRPATDDRPFFYHFFTWRQLPQLIQQYGRIAQPFGGAGFLILPVLFLLALLASGVLILLPLAFRQQERKRDRGSTLLYFAALGLGFMAVEIPCLGRFTLYLDRPLYATATVLFAMLVGSGMGSLWSARHDVRLGRVLFLLAGGLALTLLGLPLLLGATLHFPLGGRLLVSVLVLTPLGFLMGIPFPTAVRALGTRRHLIPWAWAVNGCASVLGAIGAQWLALAVGYRAVLALGAICYTAAFVVNRKVTVPPPVSA
ncbi:MAG: hypothetical protein ACP5SI_00945 [Chloroflexia bacterium]